MPLLCILTIKVKTESYFCVTQKEDESKDRKVFLILHPQDQKESLRYLEAKKVQPLSNELNVTHHLERKKKKKQKKKRWSQQWTILTKSTKGQFKISPHLPSEGFLLWLVSPPVQLSRLAVPERAIYCKGPFKKMLFVFLSSSGGKLSTLGDFPACRLCTASLTSSVCTVRLLASCVGVWLLYSRLVSECSSQLYRPLQYWVHPFRTDVLSIGTFLLLSSMTADSCCLGLSPQSTLPLLSSSSSCILGSFFCSLVKKFTFLYFSPASVLVYFCCFSCRLWLRRYRTLFVTQGWTFSLCPQRTSSAVESNPSFTLFARVSTSL